MGVVKATFASLTLGLVLNPAPVLAAAVTAAEATLVVVTVPVIIAAVAAAAFVAAVTPIFTAITALLGPILVAFGVYAGLILAHYQILYASLTALLTQIVNAANGDHGNIQILLAAVIVNFVRLADTVGAAIAILFTGLVVVSAALIQTAYALVIFLLALAVLKAQIIAQAAAILTALLIPSLAAIFIAAGNASIGFVNGVNSIAIKINGNLGVVSAAFIGTIVALFFGSLQIFAAGVATIVALPAIAFVGVFGGFFAVSQTFTNNFQVATNSLVINYAAFFGVSLSTIQAAHDGITAGNNNFLFICAALYAGTVTTSGFIALIAQQLNIHTTLLINYLNTYAVVVAFAGDAVATFFAAFALIFLNFALLAVTAALVILTGLAAAATITAAALASLVQGAINAYATGALSIVNSATALLALFVGGVATGALVVVVGLGALIAPVFFSSAALFTSAGIVSVNANATVVASFSSDLSNSINEANNAISKAAHLS